jgi:hypothetical protein
MTQSLRQDGDPLEREYADFIESRLPAYAQLWADYIGNDGASGLPHRGELSDEVNERREYTAQDLYTVLVCVICAMRLVDRKSRVTSLPEYLDVIDRLVGFYAHVGRLRDCLIHVGGRWKLYELGARMKEIYGQRNAILHDPVAPMTELYGRPAFVPPGAGLDPKQWGSESKWSESNGLTFEGVDEYLSETFEAVLRAFQSSLASLHSQICTIDPATVYKLQFLDALKNAPVGTGSATPGLVLGNWSELLKDAHGPRRGGPP